MPISAKESLEKLRKEVTQCRKCQDLVRTRKNPIPGIGAPNARIIILGDYPSESAETQGIPYTGDETGNLIRKILNKTNLSLEKNTYLTYIVKCTPKKILAENKAGNKKDKLVATSLEVRHIDNCIPFFSQEISIITPHLVVSLGLDTSNYILRNFFSLEGKYQSMNGLHMRIFGNPSFKLVPFHDPKDVIVTGILSEEKYIKDFQELSKLLKVV